jgi:hypothetical protein
MIDGSDLGYSLGGASHFMIKAYQKHHMSNKGVNLTREVGFEDRRAVLSLRGRLN